MSDGIWFQEETRTDTVKLKLKEFDTLQEVKYLLTELQDLLEEKNKAYGDSSLNPIRLFSKISAVNALCIRIDDRLSHIKNKGITIDTEDSLMDLIGYLILLKIAMKKKNGA